MENPGYEGTLPGNAPPFGSLISARVERVNTSHVLSRDEIRVFRNEGLNFDMDDLSDPDGGEEHSDDSDITIPPGLGPRFERLNRIYNSGD